MHVHYVTSNLRKFQEAFYILKDSKEWNLIHTPLEIEEIQGEPEAIVRHKAKLALTQVRAPLIVEDVSFACAALKGLHDPEEICQISMRKEALISLEERYCHVCA